jgi:hypothetical protein
MWQEKINKKLHMWYRCAMGHGSSYMSIIQPEKNKEKLGCT